MNRRLGYLITVLTLLPACASGGGGIAVDSATFSTPTAAQAKLDTHAAPLQSETLANLVAGQVRNRDTSCPELPRIRYEACLIFQGALFIWAEGTSLTPDLIYEAAAEPDFRTLYVGAVASVTPVLSSSANYGFQRDVLADEFVEPGSDAELCLEVRYGLCGNQAAIGKALLEEAGIEARYVQFFFADPDSGERNSHAVVEAMVAGRWKMIDTTYGAYWTVNSEGFDLASVDDVLAMPDPVSTAVWNMAMQQLPDTTTISYDPFEYLVAEQVDVLRGGVGEINLQIAGPVGREDFANIPSYVGDNQPDGERAGVEFRFDVIDSGKYVLALDVKAIRGSGSLCVDQTCVVMKGPGEIEFEVTDPAGLSLISSEDVAYAVLESLSWSRSLP